MEKIVAADASGCRKPGCGRNQYSRGVCESCYRYIRLADKPKCRIEGCENNCYVADLCRMHHRRKLLHGDPLVNKRRESAEKTIANNGYVRLRVPKGYPGASTFKDRPNKSTIAEHRYVMQEHLGRTLLLTEEVHHKNGNKQDNRIENLELWAKAKQPAGQRVSDLVAWAREIIARYGHSEAA